MNRIDKEKATQMHADGASDRVIADEFGVTPVAVRSWRERNNLDANHASGGRQEGSGREVTVDYDRAVVLYERGWNDSEIAEDVGCDVRTIRDWRKKERLESNFRKPEKGIVSCHISGEFYDAGAEHKCKPEEVYQITHSLPQDDLEPDMDDSAVVLPPDPPVVKELAVPVIEASLTDFDSIIEEKNAIIQDLLVKNAELAGFIDGIKFVKGWLES